MLQRAVRATLPAVAALQREACLALLWDVAACAHGQGALHSTQGSTSMCIRHSCSTHSLAGVHSSSTVLLVNQWMLKSNVLIAFHMPQWPWSCLALQPKTGVQTH